MHKALLARPSLALSAFLSGLHAPRGKGAGEPASEQERASAVKEAVLKHLTLIVMCLKAALMHCCNKKQRHV